MDNANSADYLEKIKIQVIENLRQTAHAPSVQMTDVPRTTILGGTEEDDAELDDADEDENTDSRTSRRRWDKHVERDDELDESEDEEANAANGVSRQPNVVKRQNIMDYQNANSAASDVDMDSGLATPDGRADVDTSIPTASASEINAEVNGEILVEKALGLPASGNHELGTSNAPSPAHTPKPTIDTDGDVKMGEAEEAPTVEPEEKLSTPAPAAAVVDPTPVESTVVKQEDEERLDRAGTNEASTTL